MIDISATIKDIARESGFSEATVCRALKNNSLVKDETRRRVIQVAAQLGYKTVSLQESVDKSNSSHFLGAIIPDIQNPFYASVCAMANEYAEMNGYHLTILSNGRNDSVELQQLRMLIEMNVEGLLVAPNSYDSIDTVLDLVPKSVPTVFFTAARNNTSRSNFSYVSIDDEKAAYNGTKYLIDLGHQKIFYIGGPKSSISVCNKVKGFLRALTDAGLSNSEKEKNVFYTSINGSDVKSTVFSIIDSGVIPSAIIAVNDFAALSIMSALEERGIKVPDNVSIIGFDNIELSAHPRINLTTIDQHRADLARNLIEILVSEINAGPGDNAKQIDLEAALVIRGTCIPR